MESFSIPYFIVKGEYLMVIVLAVVLVVMCTVAFYVQRRGAHGSMDREDIPEEVLARMMPDEYTQYKKLFEAQASTKISMIMPRI